MNKTISLRLAMLIAVALFAVSSSAVGQGFDQPLFNQPPNGGAAGTAATVGQTAGANDASDTTTAQKPSSVGSSAESAADAAEASTTEAATKSDSKESMIGNMLNVVTGAGPMMIPILGCSMLLVMFVLERTIALRRRRVIPKHFVKLFLEELAEGQLKPVEALELCEENNSPISEVFAGAVKKWNRPSVEVEQAVIDAGERMANGLRRYLRLFNGIATISPLLGLLGTVLGMIEAFNAIASSDAMGRPELLAEGISQALLTTAGGLSVAIPAFIAYMYFTSRVDRLIIEIDGLGQEVVSAISSDAWKPKTARKAKQSAKAA